MFVDATGGNILDVKMPRVLRHSSNPVGRILAHAEGMSDVKIQAHPRRINSVHELEVLVKPLDQQARLRFDQQVDLQLLCQLHARHQLLIEDPTRRLPILAFRQITARFGRDSRSPQFLRQVQRPLRVLPTNGSVVRVGVRPSRMPIRLPRVSDGVHHKGIQIRNRQTMPLQMLAD